MKPKPKLIKKKDRPVNDQDIERAHDSLLTLLIRKDPERAELIIRRIRESKDQGLKA